MNLLITIGLVCCCGHVPDSACLDQHDPIWERPAAQWLDGIPLANGHIGALVWGDGSPLKITLDKYDAWETRETVLGADGPTYSKIRSAVEAGKADDVQNALQTSHIYPDGHPSPTRLPIARLEMDWGQPLVWDHARLHLRTGTASLVGTVGGDRIHVTMATHAQDNVLIIHLQGPGATRARVRVGTDHLQPGTRQLLKRWGYGDPETTSGDGKGTFHVKTPAGYAYAVAWEQRVRDTDNEQTVCLALLSSEDAADPVAAAQQLAARAAHTGAAFLASHRAWWADYWTRSCLTIPDARLEALYYVEMYKLGCLSRPGGYPITLQGLWTKDGAMPPWAGDYHLDMNVQQSYWPIYTANRLDLGEPLYRTFSKCLPRWREQCQQFFGFDGIWSGCAIGPRGERVFGYTGVELWPGNAAWLAHHYWLHFLYAQDRDFLRDQALPIMRLAFLTYANLLEPGDDGKLHLPLSYSPELFEGAADCYRKDPNADLALIRFLAGAIVASEDVLGHPDPMADRARSVLGQLVDYIHADHSLLVAADTPLNHSHRHHSHLMAIHPLGLLTPAGSETDRKMIQQSLHQIRVVGTGQWTGWAFPWMSLIAARAGNGNMAWQMLDTYANWFIRPNTFHINGDPRRAGFSLFDYDPMTLEAGFGAAAAVMEMLLQSYGGCVRVFPTLPDRWHDCFFAHLRAEGAFLVTAKRVDGQTVCVEIVSEAGGPCRVANPFAGPATLATRHAGTDPAAGHTMTLAGDVLEFDTKRGACYLLYPEGKAPADHWRRPNELMRTDWDKHFYGLKHRPRF